MYNRPVSLSLRVCEDKPMKNKFGIILGNACTKYRFGLCWIGRVQ